MQIESLLKRHHPKTGVPGTTVSFDPWPTPEGTFFANKPPTPARTYQFLPVDKTDPESPHVCRDVLPEHAHRLFECNGAYRLYEDAAAAPRPATTTAPAAGAAGDPNPHVAKVAPVIGDDPDHQPVKPPVDEVPADQKKVAFDNAVAEIREMPVKGLKARINTLDKGALAAALELEKQVTGDKVRKGFIETVSAHLGKPAS